MKVIILAGGYAKSLWPLTKNTPKPLLKVGGKAIIDYILEKIEIIKDIDSIIISTNKKFKEPFKVWIKNHKFKEKVKLIIEPTTTEGKKLGTIGGLSYVINHTKIDEDLLIIGGDNIFEFNLQNFIDYYKDNKSPIIALYDMKSKQKVMNKYGVCVLGKQNKIIEFQEKPAKPKSSLISTACYIFPREDVKLIDRYLKEGNNPDAMGFFITWLINNKDVYGWTFKENWFDIGSLDELERAKKVYKKSRKNK